MANKNKAEEHYKLQDYLQSIKYAKRWLLESKDAGDRKEERAACKIIAWSYYYLRNYQESIKYGTKELRIAQEEGDKAAESEAYEVLSKSHREANKSSLGDLDGSASNSPYTASAGKDQDSRFGKQCRDRRFSSIISPHVKESKTPLDSGFHVINPGFQVLDVSLCQWNLDSGLQSSVGFRIP